MEELNDSPETVYLMKPRMGGLANNLVVQTEAGQVLYQVRAKPFAAMGRVYTIHEPAGSEILRCQQEHSAVFPRYSITEEETVIGRIGQAGIIPQQYFIEDRKKFRAKIHLGGFDSIFKLKRDDALVAEVAQHRQTWIVVIHAEENRALLLLGLALVYRVNCVGG